MFQLVVMKPDPKINEKFYQKLNYLIHMEQYFDNVNIKNSILVGDLNIAPRPDDVWDHKNFPQLLVIRQLKLST